MGGMGDIGGGCTVRFEVDHEKDKENPRLQTWTAFDGPCSKKGKKEVTITLPRTISQADVGKNQLSFDLVGPQANFHVEWK